MRRSRLCRQYFEISFVALCSQSLSAAKRIISTAAKHLGAFGAGSPGEESIPALVEIYAHKRFRKMTLPPARLQT
jgi:hypothetical protein